MGVVGLTSLIEENDFVFESFKLKDSTLVVDGCCVVHKLSAQVDVRFGGDYPRLYKTFRSFFKALHKCGVNPVVVMDGSLDMDGAKRETTLSRFQSQLDAAKKIYRGGRTEICPVFGREVFVEALRDAGVELVVCSGEADGWVARLANTLETPLLSQDSDFFIFDLSHGYIPLNSLQWNNPCSSGQNKGFFLKCKMYNVQSLLSAVTPSPHRSLLPLFATLMGNDFVKCATFHKFFFLLPKVSTLHTKRNPRTKDLKVNQKHEIMIALLKWLAAFESQEDAIDRILSLYPLDVREKLKTQLIKVTKHYDCSPTESWEKLKEEIKLEIKTLTNLPDWLVTSHFLGTCCVKLIRIRCQEELITICMVEDSTQDSAYSPSEDIRKSVYGILLEPKASSVWEHVRKGTSVAKQQIPVKKKYYKIPEFNSSAAEKDSLKILHDLAVTNQGDMKEFLDFNPNMGIVCLSVLYWCRKCVVPESHFKALCLCVWLLKSDKPEVVKHDTGDHKSEQRKAYSFGEFAYFDFDPCSSPNCRRKGKSIGLTAKTLHCFCQWQTCIQAYDWLNSVLCEPYSKPYFSQLYSGRFVYNLAIRKPQLDTIMSPVRFANFEDTFLKPLKTALGSEFEFAPEFSTKAGKKEGPIKPSGGNRKNSIEIGNQDVSSDSEELDVDTEIADIGNRFAALSFIKQKKHKK